jgi:hypothetical protein
LLASTGSAWLSSALRGTGLDAIQFESGAPSEQSLTADPLAFFRTSRLAGEGQWKGRFFFSFSAGLCGIFQAPTQFDAETLVQGAGGSLIYRLSDPAVDSTGRPLPGSATNSLRMFTEPSSAAQFCTPGTVGLSGLAPAPRQFGLSFLQRFRW